MFSSLQRFTAFATAQVRQFTCQNVVTKVCQPQSSLLQTAKSFTPLNSVYQPVRNKCFDHHFLNRWMARDYKRRVMLKKYTPLRQRYVAIKRCSVLPKDLQEVVSQELHALPRDSCYSRAHRRCILTSRARWCIHKYRVSRIQWRLLADYNKLSGVTRATW